MAFPWLYPHGRGDFNIPNREKHITLTEYVNHLLRVNIGGYYPFEKDFLWKYVALELTFKLRAMKTSCLFYK